MSGSLRSMLLSGFAFWVIIAGISLYLVFPLRQKIRLGMDLAGGTYLTLEVQTDKAVEAELIQRMQLALDKIKKARKSLPSQKSVENGVVLLSFASVQAANEALQIIKSDAGEAQIDVKGNTITISMPARAAQRVKEDAVARNIEVLGVRLDRIGVADIPIAAQGEKRIVVELPDVANPGDAKSMIGTAAQLELKLVDRVAANEEDLRYELDGDIPSDKEILQARDQREGVYLVNRYTDITGKLLRDARPSFGGQSGAEPVVSFEFTEEGGERFFELTSKNVGRRLAIVLDGVVLSAPSINEGIRNKGVISGRFTANEARELSLLLKSGAFVAPVTFEEERQVGPLLGAESIRQGLLSCIVGLILLFCFSVFFYKWCGIVAFIALLVNLLLITVGMVWLKATLTLPGIAGMVLTIGMAIDASILIFERARELVKEGKSPRDAMFGGFSGAMAIIMDANITHFIAGLVLYHFGSGPIQGFAVTLMLGIIATLLSGFFFLKSMFKFIFDNFRVQKLSI